MKGFLIVTGLLLANMVACSATFFTQNTGIVVLLFLAFLPLLWIHGFTAGKSVEIQSPIRPKAAAARPAPVGSLRRLNVEDQL